MARDYVSKGYRRVVEVMDLEKFSDRIDRDVMMTRPERRIGDRKLLKRGNGFFLLLIRLRAHVSA